MPPASLSETRPVAFLGEWFWKVADCSTECAAPDVIPINDMTMSPLN